MKNWKVTNGKIEISDAEADERLTELLAEYVHFADKLNHLTPKEVVEMLQTKYSDWFRAIDTKVIVQFVQEVDEVTLKMDVDPYWDVSIDFQKKAGDVFNIFLKDFKSKSNESKKDSRVVTDAVNKAFGKVFRISPDNRSIDAALKGNRQLNRVALRIFKKLSKMGYAF